MRRDPLRIITGPTHSIRARVVFTIVSLLVANAAAWAWALLAFRDFPLLLGTATLAYSFGLRHAFDADHIAAIDNVTRKLMQDGQRPVSVGLFFSLGHSTIVRAGLDRRGGGRRRLQGSAGCDAWHRRGDRHIRLLAFFYSQ